MGGLAEYAAHHRLVAQVYPVILGPISHRPGTSAGIPQHLRGKPRRLIDTTMTGGDLDISAAGDYVIEGNTWTTTNAVATTLIAEASGVRAVSNHATGQRLLIEIPEVSAGSLICATVEWEVVTMASTAQSVWVKLKQAAGTTDTQYDVLVACYRHSASSWRPKHGYRGSSSHVTGYTGDNPWASSQPSTVVMSVWGSGYSWGVAMSSASLTGRPPFRGLPATNNAAGSLRSRSNGQSSGDILPHMRYLALGWNSNGNNIEARVRRVIVEAAL